MAWLIKHIEIDKKSPDYLQKIQEAIGADTLDIRMTNHPLLGSAVMVCDDRGLERKLPKNPFATAIYQSQSHYPVVGDVIFASFPDELD